MDEKTVPVKGGPGERLKPTRPRLDAVRRALLKTWHPHGPAQHHLASRLTDAGLLQHVDYGGYIATKAGQTWLIFQSKTYAEIPSLFPVHFRYCTKDDRPDLATLARCNNINGPICSSTHLTTVEAEVTCKRCLRIMAGKPVGSRA